MKKNDYSLPIIIALVLLALIAGLIFKSHAPELPVSKARISSAFEQTPELRFRSIGETKSIVRFVGESLSTATEQSAAVEHYKKSLPTIERYRQDVAENPHDIPESLEHFAMKTAADMKLAKKNIENANAFFEKLQACSLSGDDDTPRAVRAFCVENARTLAKIFPGALEKKLSSLLKKLDPSINSLLL